MKMSTNSLKKNHRLKYKAIREKVLPKVEELILNQVTKKLQNLLIHGELNGYLGLYWPLKGEVDLLKLKSKLKTPIALPASQKDRTLSYHPWKQSPLKKDFCGIPAPLDEPILMPKENSFQVEPVKNRTSFRRCSWELRLFL